MTLEGFVHCKSSVDIVELLEYPLSSWNNMVDVVSAYCKCAFLFLRRYQMYLLMVLHQEWVLLSPVWCGWASFWKQGLTPASVCNLIIISEPSEGKFWTLANTRM